MKALALNLQLDHWGCHMVPGLFPKWQSKWHIVWQRGGYFLMQINSSLAKKLIFNAKLLISCVPMDLIWVKKTAMVLLFCLRISVWHARCDKNPLATYQSQLGRDSPHLRNGLYWKMAVFQFFAFYDFGHPKWPPNGKIWTRVVIGHMSGYVWRWFRPLRSAA